ncbi:DUF4212 domain-containing protein [Telmatospirillum sp.]|uniref:DUF4212 domain-containing protein n=1 Tax=Telmatospirillum sp. TaxID=2079197 RepID=UPI0028412B98|nr:DUF4212 domain-containing protein [Telmatospirillum sp.]MDR3435823.1 DUF4212 domain-containing protein [Telmatospirillum sp.]
MARGTPDTSPHYWRKTSQLMMTVLVLWFFISFGIPLASNFLNGFVLLGIPLGYFLTAFGTLVGFVILIFWYAHRQNRVDEDLHVAED